MSSTATFILQQPNIKLLAPIQLILVFTQLSPSIERGIGERSIIE